MAYWVWMFDRRCIGPADNVDSKSVTRIQETCIGNHLFAQQLQPYLASDSNTTLECRIWWLNGDEVQQARQETNRFISRFMEAVCGKSYGCHLCAWWYYQKLHGQWRKTACQGTIQGKRRMWRNYLNKVAHMASDRTLIPSLKKFGVHRQLMLFLMLNCELK